MANSTSDIFNTRDWIVTTNESDSEDFENWDEDSVPTTNDEETSTESEESEIKDNENSTKTQADDITEALKSLALEVKDEEPTDDLQANIFIKDLLVCEQRGEKFLYKNIEFNNVLICGTIISYNPRKNNACFVIHDGTGSIMTLVDDKYLRGLKDRSNEKEQFFTDSDDDESEFNTLSNILEQAIKSLPKSNPVFREINSLPGTLVKLVGNLKCYNSSRYVFVSKIVEIEPIELIELLNRKIDLEEKYLCSLNNRKQ